MNELLKIVDQSYADQFLFAIFLNICFIVISISFYLLWHKLTSKTVKVNNYQKIVTSDLILTCSTLLCNALIFVLVALLYNEKILFINFKATSVINIFIEVVLLILLIDFLMYFFHRIAHNKLLFKLIHKSHHKHIGVNELSLFVLSPLESFGFGLLLMIPLVFYPFNYLSIVIYLLINLIWGTIGHFSKDYKYPPKFVIKYIGTARFHNQHHIDCNVNFGFYTTIWDKVFNTKDKKK
ncbi:sterol desaturase family protein [Flavobacterium agricola]|uniref:Sterol desaturase family protein n=1 Tax=Flavobacterium agricola TaxID=2870839 RepID=A0ABY6M206_9FLAO|nr:sterol desaturase family protein [Flavobacterium agricola]UYW01435.1 sterol desaturase family protein [Flavobacterium agricola]